MRIALIAVAAVSFAAAAMPAQAQSYDSVASTKISTGALDKAETALLKELRIHPNRPELLLNLAAVYARTGRTGDARALYQRVLSQDDVLMDLSATQTAGSHAIARTGLRRLASTQATASN
jgi:Tfp pilus assembly protein PilF